MKAYKQAAIAVLLASVTTVVNGFNLPTNRLAAIKQRQLWGSSVPKLDVKTIKSSRKHLCVILCV